MSRRSSIDGGSGSAAELASGLDISRARSEYESVDYSRWEIPMKLHEDSYRRHLMKARREKELEDSKIEQENRECTFHPYLAPKSMGEYHRHLEHDGPVYDRLNQVARVIETKKKQAREEEVQRKELAEIEGTTFNPQTNTPRDAAIRRSVDNYARQPVSERLYAKRSKSTERSTSQQTHKSAGAATNASGRTFSARTADRLSSRNSYEVSSQVRELRMRMVEEEQQTFVPTTSHYSYDGTASVRASSIRSSSPRIPEHRSETRSVQARKFVANERRMAHRSTNILLNHDYRKQRDELLQNRNNRPAPHEYAERQQEMDQRKQHKYNQNVEAHLPAKKKKITREEYAEIISRQSKNKTVCTSDEKLGNLRKAHCETDAQQRQDRRVRHQKFYEKMKEDLKTKRGAFKADIVVQQRSKSASSIADSRGVFAPLDEDDALRREQGTKHHDPSSLEAVQKREERATEQQVARLQRARAKIAEMTAAAKKKEEEIFPSEPLPGYHRVSSSHHAAGSSHNTSLASVSEVRDVNKYRERIQRAKELAEERRSEVDARFKPKRSAVVQKENDMGQLVTVVEPFPLESRHEELTSKHKNHVMGTIRKERSETTHTFHPVTVNYQPTSRSQSSSYHDSSSTGLPLRNEPRATSSRSHSVVSRHSERSAKAPSEEEYLCQYHQEEAFHEKKDEERKLSPPQHSTKPPVHPSRSLSTRSRFGRSPESENDYPIHHYNGQQQV